MKTLEQVMAAEDCAILQAWAWRERGRAAIKNQKEQIAEVMADVGVLAGKLTRVEENLVSLTQEMQANVVRLEDADFELSERISSLEARMTLAEGRLTRLEAKP